MRECLLKVNVCEINPRTKFTGGHVKQFSWLDAAIPSQALIYLEWPEKNSNSSLRVSAIVVFLHFVLRINMLAKFASCIVRHSSKNIKLNNKSFFASISQSYCSGSQVLNTMIMWPALVIFSIIRPTVKNVW